MKILIADDEPSLVAALRIILSDAGYEVCTARDGVQAVAVFSAQLPDLVILDIVMPRIDGFGVCERIRRLDPGVPILMLSAKSDIVDKRVGFKTGADDYLTKPFEEEEILLRVEALLARVERMKLSGRSRGAGEGGLKAEGLFSEPMAAGADFDASGAMNGSASGALTSLASAGDVSVDLYRHEARVRGRSVTLTPKEFQILALFVSHPGKVFTREDLIGIIWGDEYQDSSISIPVYIRRIREKIEDDPSRPRLIKTVWCHGYRFDTGEA